MLTPPVLTSDLESCNNPFMKILPSGNQILITDQITYHHSLENNVLSLYVTFPH